MARSFKQPIRITGRGGVSLLPETRPDLSLQQVLLISVIPGDCANPHHRKAGRPAPGGAFHIGRQAALRGFIERRFRELEQQGRARLEGPLRVVGPDDSGVQSIHVVWRNLETGEVYENQVTT